MIRSHLLLRACALSLILMLAACNLPAPATPATQDVSAAYTQAAQTIIAQLTQLAGTQAPATPLPPPPGGESTESPAPALPATETASPSPEASPTPTAPPESSATPEPSTTPTAAPSPTSPPTDPRASLGDPDFRDQFNGGGDWYLYEDKDASFYVSDGRLGMTHFDADSFDRWIISWPNLDDFYLEMNADTRDCSGLDRYGMIFRVQEVSQDFVGYLFGISCDGRYSLRLWDAKKFTILVDWTASDKLLSGARQTNRIGVLADGRRLSLYANGHLLKEVQDDTYLDGRFGVFMAAKSTAGYSARVDEIAYWELP